MSAPFFFSLVSFQDVRANIYVSCSIRTNKPPTDVPRPKPRYAKPSVKSAAESRSLSNISFDSTTDIRQAIFEEWKAKRTKQLAREKLVKEKKLKEEEEKKKKVT